MTTQQETVLIIGNTGKTGARVERRLQQQGYNTRGVSRSTQPQFDWKNSQSWPAALAGATSAYVTFQPDLAVPEAESIITEFVSLAQEAGIKHIVLLSGRGEDGALKAERIVQTSGLTWNVIRASWFCQNFSEGFMLDGILSGEMVLPKSDTLEPFIDIDDIAEVAIATLTESHLHNRLFEVTGPEAISFKTCIAAIASATGRPIRYTPVSIESYINGLNAQGLPKDIQWLMHELFTVVFDGRNTPVTHDVEAALGRPATDFATYVQKTIATGVWDTSAPVVNA